MVGVRRTFRSTVAFLMTELLFNQKQYPIFLSRTNFRFGSYWYFLT